MNTERLRLDVDKPLAVATSQEPWYHFRETNEESQLRSRLKMKIKSLRC